ncbi:MAG TPA: hypothetical protein VHK01_14995, partial [Lacipirellulaceae bacterium]|nr:hypothetical protein [Lacipirellulaceae bacterium]
AADYVVWRKTLTQSVPNGTGADGDGDGVVDNDDHGVWRTNFGRSLSDSPASALFASAQSAPDSNPVSDDGGAFSTPPPLVGAVLTEAKSQSRPFRLPWRPLDTLAASRDEALLAWTTAALSDVGPADSPQPSLDQRDSRASLADVLADLASRDRFFQFPDTFDCAIAMLHGESAVTT